MKTTAKIHTDTVSFIESWEYFLNEIDQSGKNVTSTLIARIAFIEERLACTSNLDQIKKLESTKRFYKALAHLIDFQQTTIEYFTRNFSNLDDSFWQTIIEGHKIRDENKFLQHTIAVVSKQRDLVLEAWKSERDRNFKQRAS